MIVSSHTLYTLCVYMQISAFSFSVFSEKQSETTFLRRS